jgi:hypothetical protein
MVPRPGEFNPCPDEESEASKPVVFLNTLLGSAGALACCSIWRMSVKSAIMRATMARKIPALTLASLLPVCWPYWGFRANNNLGPQQQMTRAISHALAEIVTVVALEGISVT